MPFNVLSLSQIARQFNVLKTRTNQCPKDGKSRIERPQGGPCSEDSRISPKIGPQKIVYQDRNQTVSFIKADFGHFSKEYFVTDTGERAGIVVVQGESILLVRQYRLLVDNLSWEIPGGRVDDGETPEAAAVRECFEETGIQCIKPRPLIYYHVGLDTLHNPTFIYYSDQLAKTSNEVEIHIGEVDSCEWVSLPRCIEMIFEKKIIDSFSIIGLLAYQIAGQNMPNQKKG
jgi:8-oxo-dGTP pyrophosphatase MutT (NUDIX family)